MILDEAVRQAFMAEMHRNPTAFANEQLNALDDPVLESFADELSEAEYLPEEQASLRAGILIGWMVACRQAEVNELEAANG